MREVFVKGIDDSLKFSLGSDVSVICEIMDIGKAIDQITFEYEFKGNEFIKFIKKFNLEEKIKDIIINENNRYLVTAYDW